MVSQYLLAWDVCACVYIYGELGLAIMSLQTGDGRLASAVEQVLCYHSLLLYNRLCQFSLILVTNIGQLVMSALTCQILFAGDKLIEMVVFTILIDHCS